MSELTPQEDIPSRKPADRTHFIGELRQRNVFKVAAGYALTGWLIIQLVNAIFPVFDFPRWTIQFVILLVFIGFPIALILAWAFERTPEGMKRSSAVEPAESIANQTGKKLNTYIIATLGTLVVFMLVERVFFAGSAVVPPVVTGAAAEAAVPAMTPNPGLTAATPTSTAVPAISDKTIAVLPFDDFDAGGEEAYFADGLTEEILNALSRTPDLLVASRTSSFQYKDQNVDIREVASALGVAHILEGSVRRSATRLRVTAQLIRASDGFHLWSENYDRDPADIIEVQEDIAFRIATALETAMDPDALRQMVQAGTRSVEAYNDFLKGLAITRQLVVAGQGDRQAYEFFEAARQVDPAFAEAHARAAAYWQFYANPVVMRTGTTEPDESVEAMLALYHERMNLAIETATLPDQYLYRAAQAQVNLRLRAALEYLQSYRRERPNDYITNNANARLSLASRLGDRELAFALIAELQTSPLFNSQDASRIIEAYHDLAEYEQSHAFVVDAVKRFPFDENVLYQGHKLLLMGAYYDEARAIVATITGTQLPAGNVSLARLRQACADNDTAEAVRIYEQGILNTGWAGNWIALHTLNRVEEATALLRPLDLEGSLFPLSAYLAYPFLDVSQYPNLQRVLQREQIVRPTYQPVPYACNREGIAQ